MTMAQRASWLCLIHNKMCWVWSNIYIVSWPTLSGCRATTQFGVICPIRPIRHQLNFNALNKRCSAVSNWSMTNVGLCRVIFCSTHILKATISSRKVFQEQLTKWGVTIYQLVNADSLSLLLYFASDIYIVGDFFSSSVCMRSVCYCRPADI